jgi:hypothetical protein
MGSRADLFDHNAYRPRRTAPVMYRIVLTLPGNQRAERVRQVVAAKRGDLQLLARAALPAHPCRVHAYLGLRRIDDVIAALEGEGFAIDAVVVTNAWSSAGRLRSALPSAGTRARSSNL